MGKRLQQAASSLLKWEYRIWGEVLQNEERKAYYLE